MSTKAADTPYINSLPPEILVYIFSMLPKDRAAISRVCKEWNRLEKKIIEDLAKEYSLHPEIQPFLSSRVRPTNDSEYMECVRAVILNVGNFYNHYHQDKGIDFPRRPINLDSLELAIRETNQCKSDQNLIIFFDKLRDMIHRSVVLPQESTSIAVKAALIRDWMNTNQEALNEITELNLSQSGLSEVPPEIGHLSNLQYLLLFHNQLTELPSEIGNLVNLQSLILHHNQLTKLPPEISHLENLKNLDFAHNRLTELPPEIGHLRTLQTLALSDNQLTELPPQIGQLGNLQNFALSFNHLTILPPEIGNLGDLQNLWLDHNRLTELPSKIGNLGNLFQLQLGHNQLTELPAGKIGNLVNLRIFCLYQNQLSADARLTIESFRQDNPECIIDLNYCKCSPPFHAGR